MFDWVLTTPLYIIILAELKQLLPESIELKGVVGSNSNPEVLCKITVPTHLLKFTQKQTVLQYLHEYSEM